MALCQCQGGWRKEPRWCRKMLGSHGGGWFWTLKYFTLAIISWHFFGGWSAKVWRDGRDGQEEICGWGSEENGGVEELRAHLVSNQNVKADWSPTTSQITMYCIIFRLDYIIPIKFSTILGISIALWQWVSLGTFLFTFWVLFSASCACNCRVGPPSPLTEFFRNWSFSPLTHVYLVF